MNKIQIYCEQKSLFVNPSNNNDQVVVEAFAFSTVPEWVTDTLLWKLLVKDNKVKIIKGAKDADVKKKATKEEIEKLAKEEQKINEDDIAEGPESSSDEQEGLGDIDIEKYSQMSNKELFALCKEKGLEVESKKDKAYYLNILANNK